MTDNFSHISQFWKLAYSLSIPEAALLLVGIDPEGQAYQINNPSNWPENYEAARNAIVSALKHNKIEGSVIYYAEHVYPDPEGPSIEVDTDRINVGECEVLVDSLKDWLMRSGFAGSYFSESDSRPEFKDREHKRYSAKLEAVVDAWMNYHEVADGPGTPKQKLMKWLRLHARDYGLVQDDGNPSGTVIESLAKVANWAISGGAPKSSSSELEPD